MNTIVKVGIAATVIGALVWGFKAAQKAVANFKFDIVAYGKPSINGLVITIPLQVRFANPTPLPISLDQLVADIYINKNGTWVRGATVNQPLSIAPGESFQIIAPAVNLGQIFGGNIANTFTAIAAALKTRKLDVRTDVLAVYKGISLPRQSFTNTIDV